MPRRALHLLLLLFLVLPACEDEVVSAPPKKAKQSESSGSGGGSSKAGAGARATKRAAQPAAKGNVPSTSKGQVVLEPVDLDSLRGAGNDAVPEADASRVVGQLWLASPGQLSQLLSPLLGAAAEPQALVALVGQLYGLGELRGVDLDAPAAIFWVEGSALPTVVLSVETPEEMLAGLPEPVRDRQGNNYSFSLGVTRAAYLNVVGSRQVALSSDWRDFPLAREHIPQVMSAAPDAGTLAQGTLELTRLEQLVRGVERLSAAPVAALEPGWRTTREDLGVLLGSVGKVELAVRSDEADEALRLELRLEPGTEQGGLRTLVRDAQPSAPGVLFERLPASLTEGARTWLWQDLRHAPLELEAVPGAVMSPLVQVAPRAAGLEAVVEAEVARSRSLAGPSLLLRGGAGEWLAFVAPVRDHEAFVAATERRARALEGYAAARLAETDVSLLLIDAEAGDAGGSDSLPSPAWSARELLRERDGEHLELYVVAGRGPAESLPAQDEGAATGGVPQGVRRLLEARPQARPLLMAASDLRADAEGQAVGPAMVGVFTTGEALVVDVVVPRGQLAR